MEINIAKIKKRYGHKFTEAAAFKRNLAAERKILKGPATRLLSYIFSAEFE